MGDIVLSGGGSSGGGGGAVTIADGADVAQGAKADAAWDGVAASATEISILKKIASSGTGGGPATIADGADVVEGSLADAGIFTSAAGTISAKLRGLVGWFDRMVGLESDTATKSYSLQIGGAQSPGGEWHAATITNSQPGAAAYALTVRDGSALSVNSGALNTTGYGINAYSRSDSAVHSVESRDSAPLTTEYGLITRNIPSGTQTISGTVTANAGTNLNTSLLALEAGGNLAATAASLSVLDDWDETDRCKVNIIAGQVGVQGGSGAITALTQRTVIATDQPTLPVKEIRSATTAVTSVNDTASNVTLLASNANRLGATVYNDSTVELYLKLGATASATSFAVKMAAASYYEVPFGYTGIIDGIWVSDAAGAARITELTA